VLPRVVVVLQEPPQQAVQVGHREKTEQVEPMEVVVLRERVLLRVLVVQAELRAVAVLVVRRLLRALAEHLQVVEVVEQVLLRVVAVLVVHPLPRVRREKMEVVEPVVRRLQVAHREVVEVVVPPQPRGQVVRAGHLAPRVQVLLREPREKPLNISVRHHHQ